MSIVVQKFGGTSVSNTENLFKVCEFILAEKENKNDVVVVVSAQGDMTDKLISEETEITNTINPREHDTLISAGEQITAAKLVMCLNKLGHDAISFLGWQIPIITDSNFGDANIVSIDIQKIQNAFKENKIVVVAGFQGVDFEGNITTLGRGGSDTTAIALANVLSACKCEFFKDVDGVYSKDPNIYKDACKYNKLTYDEMLDLANNGAKVLHSKCISIAKENNIKIVVRSTFEKEKSGTIIWKE